jgi:CMP-N-acetylneuraminic acid synthetase
VPKSSKILTFIPARGGSKRLPNKNIKLFAGKPLIAWTIEAALKAQLDTTILVSTDSEEIAEIAKAYGAEVPFLRPPALAIDTATTFTAIEYTVLEQAKRSFTYDYIILLQPTSPLRQAFHIEQAFAKLHTHAARSVVSVTEIEHPIEWTMNLEANDSMENFVQTQLPFLQIRSQDLPKRYRLNGAVSCALLAEVMTQKTFYLAQHIYAYVMARNFSIDIDDSVDFEYAELLMYKELAKL